MPTVMQTTTVPAGPARPSIAIATTPSVFHWFAPAAHYALAAALVAGAVAHDYFGLPPWVAVALVGLAVVALVAGTVIWGQHEKVSLQSTALFLKSQVPGLLADVEALKNSPSLSPDVTNQFSQVLNEWENIKRLFGQAVVAQAGPDVATPVTPPPVG